MLFFHLHLVFHHKVEATILFGLFFPSFPSLNLHIKRRHEQVILRLFPFDWSMPSEIQTTDFIKRRKKNKAEFTTHDQLYSFCFVSAPASSTKNIQTNERVVIQPVVLVLRAFFIIIL